MSFGEIKWLGLGANPPGVADFLEDPSRTLGGPASPLEEEARQIVERLEKILEEYRATHLNNYSHEELQKHVMRFIAGELSRLGLHPGVDGGSVACSKCYTGEPHFCAKQAASLNPTVASAATRVEMEHLRQQFGELSSEYAAFKKSVPDLNELRAFKDLVSLPDYYLTMSEVEVPSGGFATSVSSGNYVSSLLRGLVTCEGADCLKVQGFFIGSNNMSPIPYGSNGVLMPEFKNIIAQSKTWRMTYAIPVTLNLYNPTVLPVKFSGALIVKGESK
jgi:hypothetical protein